MRSIRKSGITALTAAIALALGAVPVALTVPAIVASGEDSTTLTPGSADAGFVELTTTLSKGIITYKTQVQEFTGGQQCQVTSTAGPNLLEIKGSVNASQSGVAGFRDGNIGVFETTSIDPSNASQCSRVDFGSFGKEEALTLTLPAETYPDAPFSDQLRAASATVTAKVANTRNGKLTIDLLSGPNTVVKSTVVPWTNKKTGFQLEIPATALTAESFTAIKLTATEGSFTLNGARLNLVSQADAEFCPEDTYPEGAANFVEYVGEATGTAGPPGTDTFGGDCFGISLTDSATELRFLKPLDVSPDAQFLFTKTWTRTGTDFGTAPTLAGVEIDFEFSTTPAAERWNELPYCPAYLYNDAGVLTGFTPSNPASTAELLNLRDRDMVLQDDPTTTAVEGITDDPRTSVVEGSGTQFACLGEPRDASVSNTTIQVTDRIYLIGDSKMRW